MKQTSSTRSGTGNDLRLHPRNEVSWPGGSRRRTIALIALVACTAFVIVRPHAASAADTPRFPTAIGDTHTVLPVRYPPIAGALDRSTTTVLTEPATTVVTIKLRDAGAN